MATRSISNQYKHSVWIILIVFSLHVFFDCWNILAQKPLTKPYNWKSVQIVGGGFIDGIVFHPSTKGICYCRTDMGGAYRRNEITNVWEPLLDWVPYEDTNLMGIESIAIDPSNSNNVYIACGTYTSPSTPNGAVLRSEDQGKTFKRSNMLFKMGGNENGRGNGERMAVDPGNGNIIYLGSRFAGLWKSTDKGASWAKVENFPDVSENPPVGMKDQDSIRRWRYRNMGCGIVFVVFDPKKEKRGQATKSIYVGVSLMGRNNLFHSNDGGISWQPVQGQPVQYRPNHAILASDGNLYLSYGNNPGPGRMTDGGIWKLNTIKSEWTDITPDKPNKNIGKSFGYAAVAVDAGNPKVIIASSFYRPREAGGEDIFRSIDGGKTWKPVFGSGGTYDFSLAPYVASTPIHWLFDIEIDPTNPNHAMFTTGYGGYETYNLTDMDAGKPTKWSVMCTGIEETVALDLLSPVKGPHLISGIGDYGGFVHNDLDKPAPEGQFSNPRFSNTNSLAYAVNNPNLIVRVGSATYQNPACSIGYSIDGGKSWKYTGSQPKPESRVGNIAVSADGNSWIWTPDRSPVYFTRDSGKTWLASKGISENIRIVSDFINSKKFYGMDLFDGKMFTSIDGGATFIERMLLLPGGIPERGKDRGDSRGGQDRIYATPGKEGDLWIAAFDGLYHSVDSGNKFIKLDGVDEIHAFGFGKAAPGTSYSSLYLVGTVRGVKGIFRSTDIALNWVRINDDNHQWGLVLQVTGDPKLYGRVYVGTHGRGIFYGDPLN